MDKWIRKSKPTNGGLTSGDERTSLLTKFSQPVWEEEKKKEKKRRKEREEGILERETPTSL